MDEDDENGKDIKDASGGADKAVDTTSTFVEDERESKDSNNGEIEEEDANEKTESGDVESSEKKTGAIEENGGEEVVTLDDEGGDDERVATKTIPDPLFFESVSEEEKQYYEENPISADKIELMKVQCTACFKQVHQA